MTGRPPLSVIVPTLNAAGDLPAVLAALDPGDEVIVVDGGSADGGPALARSFGAIVLDASPGRGGQLAAGADAATADWMLFLHADTVPAPGWRDTVDLHMQARDGARMQPSFGSGWTIPQFRRGGWSGWSRRVSRCSACPTAIRGC